MKTKLPFICFILICSCSIHSQTVLEEIEVGKEKQSQNDCRKAIIHFQNALRKNNNSVEAKIGFAECSKSLGSLTDAKRAFGEVISRSPKNFPAVIGLSEINIDLEEFSEVPKRIDPLLEEFPNHSSLRILESRYLYAIGRKELAIHKLKNLSEKLGYPQDVEKMLGELYLRSSQWRESEESLKRYISQSPSDPDGFYLIAKLGLYRNYFHVPNLLSSLPDVEENINNALNLDKKHELSRLLLVKLKMIQSYSSGNLDVNILESAFKLIYELAREFPENKHYHALEATLGEELNRSKFASFHYRRALQIDDLDEIERFAAEEYVIKNEKEESKLRRELGDYRRDRYISEKYSLFFKSAKFHLLRAKDLNPQSPTIRRELLDSYNQSGESIQYINLLLRQREEDPTNFKMQNKLEFAITNLKQSLESKEGYVTIEQSGVYNSVVSASPEVFVFDLESKLAFPEHYFAGRLLSKALRYNLQNLYNVRLPSDSEFQTIRTSLKELDFHPYSKTIPFSVESLTVLDKDRRNTAKIRYVVHGNYQYVNDSIDVEIYLYDRTTSKNIGVWKTNQKGRDGLSTILNRISEKIKNSLPIEGKILKVKKDEVLVSLGKRDGLVAKTVVRFVRKGSLITEGDVTGLGQDISIIKPKNRGWEKELATGDFATVRSEQDTKK
ncbi:tetratricopeptide repeat protein [Leptospira ilyithenensis]|uniref:tetratricopeptide repeat protein n=1 Tax=Leptospira ilyithenensis TaxID=2484901 RepID=UPI001FEAB0CA|nr:hypothetical protein [Leptospira ilyithenensis]